MASDIVQQQVGALACGSVVDALYEKDMEKVLLPPRTSVDSAAAQEAWDNLSVSASKSAEAIDILENAARAIGL